MIAVRVYGVVAYVTFLAAFAYFAAFVVGILPGRDAAPTAAAALAIDAGLIAFFGVVHSVMARASFKRWWTTVIPAAAERSTYVLVASLQMTLLTWQWRPIPGAPLWSAAPPLSPVLTGLSIAGFGIAFLSSFLIDHLDLFGLRQAFAMPARPGTFRTPSLYRAVRHPLYLGLLVAVWAAPQMSLARLALAIGVTVYVVVGAHLEERDLARDLGVDYRKYQREVPMLLPLPRGRRRG